jgi:chromosome segregation ATPase
LQPPPFHPAYGQNRAETGAAVENPLDAELKQAQEQLATQTTRLETTREQIAQLQDKLKIATAALQKAQSDTINAGRQVDSTRAEVDTLRNILCELAARIESRNNALQDLLETTAAEAVDAENSEHTELQTDPQCSQLASTPAITSGQRGVTVVSQPR